MNIKEPVQKFTPAQAAITILTAFIMFYGIYAYFTKLPDRTAFTKKMKVLMMSDEELQRLEDAKADAEFDNEDF